MAEIDLQAIAEGVAAARGQSVEQALSDALEFTDRAALDAFLATDRRPIQWHEAVDELGKLPTMKMLKDETSPVCARITTNAGCEIYAFNWEPIDAQLSWFVGVHCFPGEPLDLDRQQRFVITDARGRATVMLADDYMEMIEQQTQGFALDVYAIALESAPGVPDA